MKTRELHSFVRRQRVGRLATVDALHRPVMVPLCFVCDDGGTFYSPVDEKPKELPPDRLARVRNILQNPEVALLFDYYDEDWRQLRFVLVRGKATLLASGAEHAAAIRRLRRKYPQYREMDLGSRPVIRIVPWKTISWP
jgi:coenzyme F420-0:L-glutamate ligase / coenzyme F420-1:gamma-L-glutamate ligase